MTIEIDVSVAAWPVAYDVVVQSAPVLIDVAVDTRSIVVVVGQLFPDIHVPVDLVEWLDYAPHGIGTGANVKVPFDAAAIESFAPSIQIGVRVAQPADAMTWADFAPAVYIGGVRVAIPLDAAEFTEFAPTIASGVNLDIPIDLAAWLDRAPGVGFGVDVSVSDDNVEWADFAPIVLTGVNVSVALDTVEWADFSPSLSVAIDAPNDLMVWGDYAPVISVGALVATPADAGEWNDYVMVVSSGATVPAPADAMEWQDYAPVIVSGAGMEFPSDETVWTDYVPVVASGVNLQIPASEMAWRDFGVVAGYGFSAGFSSGFNAVPSAAGAGVPADTVEWEDFAPTVEAKKKATREYRAQKTASDQNSATLTVAGCDTGAAEEGRYVFAFFFFAFGGSAVSVPSATIGGVPATVHAVARRDGSSSSRYYAVLISAPLDTGTTADVSITLSASRSCSIIRCATYRATSLQSNTPVDAVAVNNDSGTTHNHVIDALEGGIVFAAVQAESGSALDWTGLVEDFDTNYVSNLRVSAASLEVSVDETDMPFASVNTNGSFGHVSGTVAASFR